MGWMHRSMCLILESELAVKTTALTITTRFPNPPFFRKSVWKFTWWEYSHLQAAIEKREPVSKSSHELEFVLSSGLADFDSPDVAVNYACGDREISASYWASTELEYIQWIRRTTHYTSDPFPSPLSNTVTDNDWG